jgi:hypothetical protein
VNLISIAAKIAASPPSEACTYVDLDETLIHSFSLLRSTGLNLFRKYPGEKLQMGAVGVLLRPGAREFLAALKEYGPVYMLTHSVFKYASTISVALDLDVDTIYSRENLSGRVGKGQTIFVIVDDLDPLHPIMQMKMASMGVVPYPMPEEGAEEEDVRAYYATRQIRTPEFVGNPKDQGLVGVAERVGEMLAIMSAQTPSAD